MLQAGSKVEVRARVSCARLAISTLSHWLARQILNYTTGRSLSKQREEPVHPGDFMYLLPPHTERGGLLGLGQSCHHLPATSTNRGYS